MRRNKKTESGQSLFEALLALVIFVVAVATIAHLFFGAHFSAVHSAEKSQAALLAKEGIEAVRSIRDDDFGNIEAKTGVGIELVDNKWDFQNDPDEEGKFTRTINIEDVSGNAELVWKVTSTVTWQSIGDQASSVSFTEHLTAWRLPQGLVGYWKLDEDPAIHGTEIRDSSPYGNHGTLYTDDGTANKSVAGKINKAIQFDGVDDGVSVADSAELRPGTSDLSINVWIKPPNKDQSGMFFNKREPVSPYNFFILGVGTVQDDSLPVDSKKISFWIYEDSSNHQYTHTNDDIIDGNWHMVTFIRTGDIHKIYVNGAEKSTTNAKKVGTGPYNINNNYPVNFGHLNELDGWYYEGLIDDVRIYNRALTEAEIQALYNEAF